MIFVLLTISTLLCSIYTQECPTLTPGTIENTLCAKNTEEAPNKFTIQECAKNNVCFFDPSLNANGKCEQVTVNVAAYPGSPCNPKAENPCIVSGSKCGSDNKCSGAIQKDQPCTQGDATFCDLGLTCLATASDPKQFTCQNPLANGAACSRDADCVYGSGCLSSKCTAFFSVPSGQDVGSDYLDSNVSYCASGLSVDGKCIDYAPTNPANGCTDDASCIASPASIVSDVCQCTWNGQGKRCKIGTADPITTKLINTYKTIFATYNKCNADEKVVPCNYYQIAASLSEFKVLEDFSILLWQRDNTHRIPGITDNKTIFIYKNVTLNNNFSQLNTPVDPIVEPTKPKPSTQFTCPKFTCGDAKQNNITHPSCGIINQPHAPSSLESTVTLYNLCKGNEVCGNIRTRPADFFLNTNLTCNNITVPVITKYPGEACSTNTDCYSNVCNGGKCAQNQANNTACADNRNCTVGYFCNNTVCSKQGGSNAECTSSYGCANNMLCISGKCAKAYSQPLGADFTLPTNEPFYPYACSSGRYDATLKTCVQRITVDKFDATSKLTTCMLGQSCKYINKVNDTVKSAEFSLPCECGYNDKGLGYCPVSDDQLPTQLKSSIDSALSALDNNCHTLNRYQCTYLNNAKTNSTLKKARLGFGEYHLYYGAPGCVADVLAASFLKISSVVLIALAALLF